MDAGPPTQGLYSKMIGKGNAGLYFAVLQANGAIARTLSGQLVGLAYGHFGPSALWAVMLVLGCSMAPLFYKMWPRMTLEHIRQMHVKLSPPPAGDFCALSTTEDLADRAEPLLTRGGGGGKNPQGAHEIARPTQLA